MVCRLRAFIRICISALLGLSLWTGCQTPSPATPAAPAAPQKLTAAPVSLQIGRGTNADRLVGSDECSSRLHDIEGALMAYYAVNSRLPDTLDQIKPYAEPGAELKFTCPVSGKPYAYSAAGLMAAGDERRVVVWDPTPAHDGSRWCIFMPRLAPGKPATPDVLLLSQKVFSALVPAIQ